MLVYLDKKGAIDGKKRLYSLANYQ